MTSQAHEAVGPSPRPYSTTLLAYFLCRVPKRSLTIVAIATAMLWSLILMGGSSLPILLPATGSGQRQAIQPNSERLTRGHQYPLVLVVSSLEKREMTPRAVTHECLNVTGRQRRQAKGRSFSCYRGPSGPSLPKKSQQHLRPSHLSIARTTRQQEKPTRLLSSNYRKQSPKAATKASMHLS